MLDVANQFGDGGVRKIYVAVNRPGMSETDVLEAIADETVARIGDAFKAGVRARRDHFLETPMLSNQPLHTRHLRVRQRLLCARLCNASEPHRDREKA